jgi:CheY-like chemotaxis protein
MSKILIIEDEAAIRRVLSKYFLRRVQVEDAEDGAGL